MALRRKSKPAQTEFDAITDRLDRVERALQVSRQPGPTSMQSVDTETYHDPAPWETVINWPGSHVPATPSDTFQYYHPGDIAMGGSTPAGYKAISGVKPIPWMRRSKGGAALLVQGVFLDDEQLLNAYALTTGSDDAATYFDTPNAYTIRGRVHGVYEFIAEGKWSSPTNFDGPSWFTLHDTIGYPTAMPGMPRPTGYNQLGSTTSGYWRGRYPAFTSFHLDIAQLSGSDKTFDSYYFEVHYVGDYTGPERVDDTQWDQ